jgi:hypothetical protein
MIRVVHPGSGSSFFLPIPDPEVKKAPDPGTRGQKGTGSRIRICNTVEEDVKSIFFLALGKPKLIIEQDCMGLEKSR